MNPAGRNTRNSQRAISEALRGLSQLPTETPDLGGPRPPSASPAPDRQSMSVIPEDVDAPPINPAVPSHPGTPEEPDIPINNDEDDDDHTNTQSLAQSLTLLTNKIGSISGSKSKNAIKPRVPDTFDGTDPQKLQTFTFQCSMYLSARASDFPDKESKVTFALSYLKGTPLDWFYAEIRTNFGPHNPVTDAMNALENLHYKDSSKTIHYNVKFTRHACLTGWN